MTDIDKLIGKKTVIPIILILFALLLVIYFFCGSLPDKKYSFRPGYHILLLDKQDNSLISSLLDKSGRFDEIISSYNTDVEYTDYNKLKTVKVSRLKERFNTLDPRLDSFMDSVQKYFFTASDDFEKEIIYIKTSLSESETVSILNDLLPEKTVWKIASLSRNSRIRFLYPFLFALITASLVYVKKMKSFFFFFISAVWIISVYNAEISFFYVSVVNIVFISYIMEIIELILKNWFDSEKFGIDIIINKKNLLIAAFVFIVSNALIAFVNPSVELFLLFNSVFTVECLVLYLDLAFSLKKASSYIHRIFSNIAIIESNKSRIFDKWLIVRPVYFYLFVLLVTLPAVFLNPEKSSSMLPVPQKVHGITGDNMFSAMKQLSGFIPENRNNVLPDISDYFKHLAYQIRLPYKNDYSLPSNNEEITISHYYSNKNNFKEGEKTVYLFTDSWLKDKIIAVKDTGLTGLMFSEDIPVKIVYSDTSSVINPLFFGSIYCIFYIVLIFIVIWKVKTEKTNYEKHILPVIKRRKQQAA